jgi:uncharacterized protein
MAISLYEATVESYEQALGGVAGFLDRGLAHCQDQGLDPADLVATRLFQDMAPLSFQIVSVSHHSIGAIEGASKGAFGPPGPSDGLDYAGLQKIVADARAALGAVKPEAVNGLAGKDVVFSNGNFKLPFTAEGFFLSFSLPNFYFHATTAYDILRSRGVPLGKRDFIGRPRLKA